MKKTFQLTVTHWNQIIFTNIIVVRHNELWSKSVASETKFVDSDVLRRDLTRLTQWRGSLCRMALLPFSGNFFYSRSHNIDA
jgi:hypothetical protein